MIIVGGFQSHENPNREVMLELSYAQTHNTTHTERERESVCVCVCFRNGIESGDMERVPQ
jgi:hypothetical protein